MPEHVTGRPYGPCLKTMMMMCGSSVMQLGEFVAFLTSHASKPFEAPEEAALQVKKVRALVTMITGRGASLTLTRSPPMTDGPPQPALMSEELSPEDTDGPVVVVKGKSFQQLVGGPTL